MEDLTLWSLLGIDSKLLTHSGKDDNVYNKSVLQVRAQDRCERTGVSLLLGEELSNLVSTLSVWNLDIILGLTIFSHQGKEVIVRDIELW